MESKVFQTILVIILLEFLMLDEFFLSPQKKRIVIISNKHSIYNLPQELPKNLRSQEIRKYQEDLKTSQNYSLMLSLSPKMKTLPTLAKIIEKQKLNFSHRALFHTKTTVSLKYFGQDCTTISTRLLAMSYSCYRHSLIE